MDSESQSAEKKKGELTPIDPKSAVRPKDSKFREDIKRLIDEHGAEHGLDGIKRAIDIVWDESPPPGDDDDIEEAPPTK